LSNATKKEGAVFTLSWKKRGKAQSVDSLGEEERSKWEGNGKKEKG